MFLQRWEEGPSFWLASHTYITVILQEKSRGKPQTIYFWKRRKNCWTQTGICSTRRKVEQHWETSGVNWGHHRTLPWYQKVICTYFELKNVLLFWRFRRISSFFIYSYYDFLHVILFLEASEGFLKLAKTFIHLQNSYRFYFTIYSRVCCELGIYFGP